MVFALIAIGSLTKDAGAADALPAEEPAVIETVPDAGDPVPVVEDVAVED